MSAGEVQIGVFMIVIIIVAAAAGSTFTVILMNLLGYLERPDVMPTLERNYDSAPESTQKMVDLVRDSFAIMERLATSVVPVDSAAYRAIDRTEDVLREISDGKPSAPPEDAADRPTQAESA